MMDTGLYNPLDNIFSTIVIRYSWLHNKVFHLEDKGCKYQAYNDVYLSSGYNEPTRKESFPERGYLSSGYIEPTRKKSVPEDYNEPVV